MVEIIAEIGLNHNGDLDEAKRLIDAAKSAGADTAKFQASHPEAEVSRRYEQKHFDMIARLAPDIDFLAACKAYCEARGIGFLCTPADVRSLDELIAMGVTRLKIGSDNLTNAQMLQKVMASDLPMVLSTGMARDDEIEDAIQLVGWYQVSLMHCTSSYPCDVRHANLRAIAEMKARWPADAIGWSDHTVSLTLPAVAVGFGATIIEKHITTSQWNEGPDHGASLDPMMFGMMVRAVREAEAALGDGEKRLMPCEEGNARLMRKSLMASRPVKKGDKFTAENLTAKRPGWGRSAMDYYAVLGTVAAREYDADEMVD